MPVVSARSSRVIKTPRRFMDEDPPKPPKVEVSPTLRPPIATSPLAPQEPAPAPSPPRAPTPPSTPVPLPEKRRSILREPTFRWTSLTRELPPPPPAPPPAPPPLPAPVTPSRRPLLLRAPQFTPSEAHLKIYESVLTTPPLGAPEAPEPEPPPADDSPAEPEPRALGRTNHLSLPRFAPVVATPIKAEMPSPGAPAPSSGQQPHAQLQQPLQALQTQLLPPALPPQQSLLQPQLQLQPPPQQAPPLEKARIAGLGSLPLSGVEEKMFSLLKRAKVQLIKIDQQQQQKVASLMPVSMVLWPGPCIQSLRLNSLQSLCLLALRTPSSIAGNPPSQSFPCPPASWVPSLAPFVLTLQPLTLFIPPPAQPWRADGGGCGDCQADPR